ncbi:MAG: thioesterase family protein [Oscillospiraceae bacterium]
MIYVRTPQYHETAQTGIVHDVNILCWFEEARVYYLEKIGFVGMKLTSSPLISPVLAASIKYHIPILLKDYIQVITRLTMYNGFRYIFYYEVQNRQTGAICSTGTTAHCFLHPNGKPVRMKREFPELHERLLQCVKYDRKEWESQLFGEYL